MSANLSVTHRSIQNEKVEALHVENPRVAIRIASNHSAFCFSSPDSRSQEEPVNVTALKITRDITAGVDVQIGHIDYLTSQKNIILF